MEVDPPHPVETLSSKYCFIYKTTEDKATLGSKPRDSSVCIVEFSNISVEGLDVDPNSFSEYLKASFSGIVRVGWGDTFVDNGLDSCIQTMNAKEKSNFILLFPKQINCTHIETPPLDPIIVKCTIFMDSFSQPDEIYEMSNAQLFEDSLKHKDRGVELFKEGRTVDAFLRFSKAFKLFCFINKSGENVNGNEVVNLGLAILNNIALCQFKFGHFPHVIEVCAKALAVDPQNEKALYRRAVAYIELNSYESAEEDLMTLLKIKPHARHVIEKYKELKTLTKEVDEKYAGVIKKMFS